MSENSPLRTCEGSYCRIASGVPYRTGNPALTLLSGGAPRTGRLGRAGQYMAVAWNSSAPAFELNPLLPNDVF